MRPVVSIPIRREVAALAWSVFSPETDVAVSFAFSPEVWIFDLARHSELGGGDGATRVLTLQAGSAGIASSGASSGHNCLLYWPQRSLAGQGGGGGAAIRRVVVSSSGGEEPVLAGSASGFIRCWLSVRSPRSCLWSVRADPQRSAAAAPAVVGLQVLRDSVHCYHPQQAQAQQLQHPAQKQQQQMPLHRRQPAPKGVPRIPVEAKMLLLSMTAQGVAVVWDLSHLRPAAFGAVQAEPLPLRRLDFSSALPTRPSGALLSVQGVSHSHPPHSLLAASGTATGGAGDAGGAAAAEICCEARADLPAALRRDELLLTLSDGSLHLADLRSGSLRSQQGSTPCQDPSGLSTARARSNIGVVGRQHFGWGCSHLSSAHAASAGNSSKGGGGGGGGGGSSSARVGTDVNRAVEMSYDMLRQHLSAGTRASLAPLAGALPGTLPGTIASNAPHTTTTTTSAAGPGEGAGDGGLEGGAVAGLACAPSSYRSVAPAVVAAWPGGRSALSIAAHPYRAPHLPDDVVGYSTGTLLQVVDFDSNPRQPQSSYPHCTQQGRHHCTWAANGKSRDVATGVQRSNMRRCALIATTLPGYLLAAEPGACEVLVSTDLQTYLCCRAAAASTPSKSYQLEFLWESTDNLAAEPTGLTDLAEQAVQAEVACGVEMDAVEAVPFSCGGPLQGTTSRNTVEAVTAHRLVLQQPYVGPRVQRGQPRQPCVLIRTNLVPSGLVDTAPDQQGSYPTCTTTRDARGDGSQPSTAAAPGGAGLTFLTGVGSASPAAATAPTVAPLCSTRWRATKSFLLPHQATALAAHPTHPAFVLGLRDETVLIIAPQDRHVSTQDEAWERQLNEACNGWNDGAIGFDNYLLNPFKITLQFDLMNCYVQ